AKCKLGRCEGSAGARQAERPRADQDKEAHEVAVRHETRSGWEHYMGREGRLGPSVIRLEQEYTTPVGPEAEAHATK
ncbi:unnamed protein product, partial [Dovyalis caffra]